MKNLSLTLNVVLLLAVGFLYYKQFSGPKTEVPAEQPDSTAVIKKTEPVVLSDLPKDAPIVFINADSIFAHYELAKKTKASVEGKVSSYRKQYEAKVTRFQQDYQDYMEKAGAGQYTKEKAMEIEADLQKRRDDIMMMEQNQEKVMDDMDKNNTEVQQTIYDYLTRFNKEHGYYCVLAYTYTGGGILGVKDSLDVTKQVIQGLNADYKAKNQK